MKNLFTAIVLGIALVGASYAQTVVKAELDGARSSKPRIAVIEFDDTTGSMSYEAKRQLQASIAFAMVKNRDFNVPDVRNTRALGTGPAVAIGKKLGVDYVLTGSVIEYSTTAGRMTVRTQLVKVGTGTLTLLGDTTGQSSMLMTMNAGHAEMSAKVVKPLIEKLTAKLKAAAL